MNNTIENNQATIIGVVASGFAYDHEVFGERFYKADVRVERLSGVHDIVPVMLSERLVDVNKDHKDRNVRVDGQFRSYNQHEGTKTHLLLRLFAREIGFMDEMEDDGETNRIYLNGYVCKKPIHRRTPLGREVTELLLAVNRPYGKSDYIPCICWGRTAHYASDLDIGDHCVINGRIQSREYLKRMDDGHEETKTAFEVSVTKMERIER